jgi:hypothetical protein
MEPRCPGRGRSSGFLRKDRKKYGSQDPRVVKEGGRKVDSSLHLVSEVLWIPNGEVVDASSQAEMVRRREGGSFISIPSKTREGLYVGIFRCGACPTTLKVPS